MRALILVLIPLFLSACATERVVEVPVPVEVVRTEYIDVPPDLLRNIAKTSIPNHLTYGEALTQWSQDRATIDKLNALILGIKSLNEQGPD